VTVYTQPELAQTWLGRQHHRSPVFACLLGFTATGLIDGISAAGKTPQDRRYTAIADAEFLINGPRSCPQYPLPPLTSGASPTLISRAVIESCHLPVYLFNAGLRHAPTVPTIDLGGTPAHCLSNGQAMQLCVVEHLLNQGLHWGEKLAATAEGYLILSECVVGGTTTALSLLTGLGWNAVGKVNSSHATCNHDQKWQLVQAGLQRSGLKIPALPLPLVAAVGDPMQIALAGMAIAASRHCGVLLAGGTQMLAIYALMQALEAHQGLTWNRDQVLVGTTRWVAEDPTGDTVGLANLLQAPLVATRLSFAQSRFPQLQAYEQGFVKEGVGAGGCAIAAHLIGWSEGDLLEAIERLLEKRLALLQL